MRRCAAEDTFHSPACPPPANCDGQRLASCVRGAGAAAGGSTCCAGGNAQAKRRDLPWQKRDDHAPEPETQKRHRTARRAIRRPARGGKQQAGTPHGRPRITAVLLLPGFTKNSILKTGSFYDQLEALQMQRCQGNAARSVRALSGLSPSGCVEARPKGPASRRQHSPAMPPRSSLPDDEIPRQVI